MSGARAGEPASSRQARRSQEEIGEARDCAGRAAFHWVLRLPSIVVSFSHPLLFVVIAAAALVGRLSNCFLVNFGPSADYL